MATKSVCCGRYQVASQDGSVRVPPVLERIDTNNLPLVDFEGSTGFELVKSSDDLGVFDTADGAGRACLCLGGMWEDIDCYVVIAFCDWKQVEVADGELRRCYISDPDSNHYDEIIFPDIKEDAVYQMFAFEMPIVSLTTLHEQTFRIKLYPRAIKFTKSVDARGHIRAINLANYNDREYRKGRLKWQL